MPTPSPLPEVLETTEEDDDDALNGPPVATGFDLLDTALQEEVDDETQAEDAVRTAHTISSSQRFFSELLEAPEQPLVDDDSNPSDSNSFGIALEAEESFEEDDGPENTAFALLTISEQDLPDDEEERDTLELPSPSNLLLPDLEDDDATEDDT